MVLKAMDVLKKSIVLKRLKLHFMKIIKTYHKCLASQNIKVVV